MAHTTQRTSLGQAMRKTEGGSSSTIRLEGDVCKGGPDQRNPTAQQCVQRGSCALHLRLKEAEKTGKELAGVRVLGMPRVPGRECSFFTPK